MSSLHEVNNREVLSPPVHLHALYPNGFDEMCKGLTLNLSCEFNVIISDNPT